MEANYVLKDSTTLVQEELVKNELNQIELQYNALKQQKFNELLKENQELKKQLEENKDKINWYENFEINKTIDKLRIKHNNQQKEFIKYLEDEIKRLKENDIYQPLQKMALATHEHILQKYKSIIGVSDEKK